MEFNGRIIKVLPVRTGTSQNGEWKALPFVFEYFEHDTDRYADSVLLETFDEKVINNLKEGMEVCCGWSHKAKDIKKKDGSGMIIINEMRLYKIKCIKLAPSSDAGVATNGDPAVTGPQPAPFPQPNSNENENDDDLPF